VGQDGFRLGPEEHPARPRGVVERFDAKPVAGQEQCLRGVVPHGEREHAVQVGDALGAPLQVDVEQHLGVGPGAEAVAVGDQLGAQLGEVVDLSAETEHDLAAPPGAHGLGSALDVDHREPGVPDPSGGREPHAVRVRAPAAQGLGHGFQDLAVGAQVSLVVDPAGDATHATSQPLRCDVGRAPRSASASRSAHAVTLISPSTDRYQSGERPPSSCRCLPDLPQMP
jgi:hypothetical protein